MNEAGRRLQFSGWHALSLVAAIALTAGPAPVRAAERFRFALWKGDVSIELGPFAAVNCLYFIKESISGINSAVSLPPNPADLVFAGAGLGFDYDLRFGPGLLRLGLRGDIALTPLASADGTLGDPIVFPWRALLLAGYDLPLGVHKGRI